MLRHKLFGTKRVAVVRDIFDRRQDRMHLVRTCTEEFKINLRQDTIFNIASDSCVVALETVLGKDSLRRSVPYLLNRFLLIVILGGLSTSIRCKTANMC
jgi:hypothetical protein